MRSSQWKAALLQALNVTVVYTACTSTLAIYRAFNGFQVIHNSSMSVPQHVSVNAHIFAPVGTCSASRLKYMAVCPRGKCIMRRAGCNRLSHVNQHRLSLQPAQLITLKYSSRTLSFVYRSDKLSPYTCPSSGCAHCINSLKMVVWFREYQSCFR